MPIFVFSSEERGSMAWVNNDTLFLFSEDSSNLGRAEPSVLPGWVSPSKLQ